MLGTALSACIRNDPLATIPVGAPPAGGTHAWFEVRLAEDVVGVEERVFSTTGAERVLWRRRWQRVEVEGREMDLRSGSRAVCHEGRCRRVLWHGAERLWEGDGRELDMVEGPWGAEEQVLLPLQDEVVAGPVEVVGRTARLESDGMIAEATFDGAGLRQAHIGQLSWHRVPTRPPAWDPIDLTARLSVSVPRVASPRRRRVARYLVDGVDVSVVSVLRAELPHRPRPVPPGPLDDAVGAFAVRATAGTDGLVASIGALSAAVAAELVDVPTGGRSTATQVLAEQRGDCTEHVSLFIEAARRLGVDARPMAGLLLVERDGSGALVPHLWAEVEVDSRWVSVDPTYGSFPADAARIPLGPRIDVAMDRVASGIDVAWIDMR